MTSSPTGTGEIAIGLYGSGQKRLGERLTVGLVQTLAKGVPRALKEHIGHTVVDECHITPAPPGTNTFTVAWHASRS